MMEFGIIVKISLPVKTSQERKGREMIITEHDRSIIEDRFLHPRRCNRFCL